MTSFFLSHSGKECGDTASVRLGPGRDSNDTGCMLAGCSW